MRCQVFKYEGRVALSMLAVGAVGMPAVIWSRMYGNGSLAAFYAEFYGAFIRFERDWWAVPIAVVIPLFLFEGACTLVWAWKNKKFVWEAARPTREKKKKA